MLTFAVSLYFMGSRRPGHRHRWAQHLLALGHRLCRHRRCAAAARHSRGQEPLRLARQAHVRKRSGDRRAASGRQDRRDHAHAAQGRHDPAGAAEMDRANRASKSRDGSARRWRWPTADVALGAASGGAASGRAAKSTRRSGRRMRSIIAPDLEAPIQLMHGDRLQPLIGDADGMLLGELTDRNRKIWVLSDPDVISNHGLARAGNAALAVAMIKRLRSGSGSVVFDETVHGFISEPASPLLLLFRFPVRGGDHPGRDRDRTAAVGDARTLRRAAAGAAAAERRPPGTAAEHRQAGRIHRSSGGDGQALRAGDRARRRPPAACAARAFDARHWSPGCNGSARRAASTTDCGALMREAETLGGRPAAQPGVAGAAGARHSPMEGGDRRWTFKTSARSLTAFAARSARRSSARTRSST